jgi:chromate transporter
MPTDVAPPSLRAALRFWLLLGCISFGGPAGQIAVMHDELVERRRWVDEATFLRALDVCMLLPGPEAMQLATWLGWRLHGLRGGLVAGALFVLPAALLLGLLSWLYVRFGQTPVAGGVLLGLQAAVLGIVLHALQKIGTRVLRTPFAAVLAILALAAVALVSLPFPLIVAAAATAGALVARLRPGWLPAAAAHGGHGPATIVTAAAQPAPPTLRGTARVALALVAAWWIPLAALTIWPGTGSTALAMGLFFSKAALVTFGGAYAVLPYVAQQAVDVHGWLDAEQMMAGLGLAETTPGPLILVLEFVGFVGGWQQPDLGSPLASALLCAAVTLWATFLPSFLFVLAGAPWFERVGAMPRVAAALAAVTAAVVGVIAHLALWFGAALLAGAAPSRQAFVVLVAAAAWYGLARRRWHVALVVPAAGAAGALLQALG